MWLWILNTDIKRESSFGSKKDYVNIIALQMMCVFPLLEHQPHQKCSKWEWKL